jgi:hypothetical protein
MTLATILQRTAAEDPVPDVHAPARRDMEEIEAEKVMLRGERSSSSVGGTARQAG